MEDQHPSQHQSKGERCVFDGLVFIGLTVFTWCNSSTSQIISLFSDVPSCDGAHPTRESEGWAESSGLFLVWCCIFIRHHNLKDTELHIYILNYRENANQVYVKK